MAPRSSYNGYVGARTAVIGLAKTMSLWVAQLGVAEALPIGLFRVRGDEETPMEPGNPNLYLYLGISMLLVLLGGAFAGLTIALMGQDGVYLQVIATSGEGQEQRHAQKVYRLLERGKHWVLVTLLLSNVITNETLPVLLDRSIGGGWPAVLSSTVLIVIFGEVIPQAVCVRYGLQIGAYCTPFVLMLMYILAPVAYPTAKLLDYVLGEDHGTVYKKSGLKTLVTLHKTLGSSPGDRLNQDEVTIISAVLDLKDKPVGDIMTPMDDVFTMSADTVLDEAMMDRILSAGYSRIPIYEPGNDSNFVGMLLVKILITYDPEDAKKVSDFALATLPETRPETSCLDIVNFFQEGKSHMVLVSEYPGENYGGLGVVTLEDVIEELIGEEIIDESDVYIDVHKAIRRLTPAPKARLSKGHIVVSADIAALTAAEDHLIELNDDEMTIPGLGKITSGSAFKDPNQRTTFLVRRTSVTDGTAPKEPMLVRASMDEVREHLKHLGPSNLASRPRGTRYSAVKIKPGVDGHKKSWSVVSDSFIPNDGTGERDNLLAAVEDSQEGTGYGVFASGDKSADNDQGLSRSGTSSTSSSMRTRRMIARSGEITENTVETGGVRKIVLETTDSSGDLETHVGDRVVLVNPDAADSDDDEETPSEVKPQDVKKKQRRKKRSRKPGDSSGGPA